jgi:2-C-methyl-D-erythritol 4-phosphate cytidylyltransferase
VIAVIRDHAVAIPEARGDTETKADTDMEHMAVILPAAGESRRFGRDKLAEPLAGISVLQRTLTAYTIRADVAQVIVVGRALSQEHAPKIQLARGGSCRAESVANGLEQVRPDVKWVAVHDAARPLVSQPLIDRVFEAARQHGAAAPALPVGLTIKDAPGPLPARVRRTVPRETLWAMQTPQIMRTDQFRDAYARCRVPLEMITDDVQLLELAEMAVMLVEGEESNLKLTTPMDLKIAEMWIEGAIG